MDNTLRLFRPDPNDNAETTRIVEALLFASATPLGMGDLATALPPDCDVQAVLESLQERYAGRGVELVQVAGKWLFRTAADLGHLLNQEAEQPRKLSRAALETLAIIAYHQPATRAEIEDIRGVSAAKGTLDLLMELGWVRMRGRRRSPGRPVTYGTTEAFLVHFGLDAIADLPGIEELKGTGLIEGKLPAGFGVPFPSDDPVLREDEDPLEDEVLDPLDGSEATAEDDQVTLDLDPELDPDDGKLPS